MQFFPMAWAMFIFFLFQRIGQLGNCQSRFRMAVSGGVLLLSLVAAVMAVLISSPWLSYATGIGVIFAWLLARARQLSWQHIVALMSLPAITINFPAGFDTKLIQYLQMQSSFGASAVLDAVSIPHLLEGNTLLIKAKRLFVDEACSGVDSFYALIAISLTILLWTRQKLAVAVCALAMVPIWTFCSNISRLITIALGLEWFGIDLSAGLPHTVLGTVTFVVAFMCDFSFILLLSEMFAGIVRTPVDETSFKSGSIVFEQRFRPLPTGRFRVGIWLYSLVMAACFLFVGGYSAKVLVAQTMFTYPDFSQSSLERLGNSMDLPADMMEWKFRKKELTERSIDNVMGRFSHTWVFDASQGYGIVSTDFPFRGFHLLDICYEGAGWRAIRKHEILNVEIKNPHFSELGPMQVHFLDLKKGIDEYMFVAYTLFNLNGSPVISRSGTRGFERFEQTIMEPVSYQIQVVAGSTSPLDEQDKIAAVERLKVAAAAFRPAFQLLDVANSASSN